MNDRTFKNFRVKSGPVMGCEITGHSMTDADGSDYGATALKITGHHKARLEACPSQFLLRIILVTLCAALIGGALLAKAGQARHAAWHYAEARV